MKARDLSPAQLEVMNVVWGRGEVGVAEVWAAVGRTRPVARNTVQTTLARLAERGWLRQRPAGNAYLYSAARPRGSVASSMLARLLDTAFDGSAAGLVLALLDGRRVSPDEADRIRRMIDRAEHGGAGGEADEVEEGGRGRGDAAGGGERGGGGTGTGTGAREQEGRSGGGGGSARRRGKRGGRR